MTENATPTIRVLERVRLTCPLGIRFWDPVTQRVEGDGLVVTVAPIDRPDRRQFGRSNRSGGFVFQDLPGLRSLEIGDEDDAPVFPSPPLVREFIVRMNDPRGRFLPLSVRAVAPHAGWLGLHGDASPPDRPADSLPLFSSPGRPLGSGLAVVRADLWDALSQQPAAWAVLEVSASTPGGSVTARGLSNADGRVVVVLPYPEMAPPPAPTSPPPSRIGLSAQSWELTLTVRYAGLTGTETEPPDLGDILGQATGTLLDQQSPATPLAGATLLYGQELILRSSDDGRGRVLVHRA